MSERAQLLHGTFETSLGRFGMALSERGVVALQPFSFLSSEQAETTFRRRFHLTSTGFSESDLAARSTIARELMPLIRLHFTGELQNFSDVPIDLSTCSDFSRRVFHETRKIATGSVVTYGEIATALGQKGAARAVGQALGANPIAVVIPCHRVVSSGGGLGGFSLAGGKALKKQLLNLERANTSDFQPNL